MKQLLVILGSVFVFSQLNAQQNVMPQTNYYYADGVPQYWTVDSTSVNIIVKNRHNYNAIVQNLQVLFFDSTDVIFADDEDDNIIVNSFSLPLIHKDSLIAAISIVPDDIAFFTYSKIVDSNYIWLRNDVYIKLKDSAYFLSYLHPTIQNYSNISVIYEGDNEYRIICQTESDVITLANLLYDTLYVMYSTPDFYADRSLHYYFTNDPLYDKQDLGCIYARDAWNFLLNAIGSLGLNIKVAVIDDGVEEHEDLYFFNGTSKVLTGWTVNNDGTGRPRPNHGHGQCCTGIISATHNDKGIAGVAPNTQIVPIRIFKNQTDKDGKCKPFSDAQIAKGIEKAWKLGAKILSNSWGGGAVNTKITNAIDDAVKNGIVVIFSSGNDFNRLKGYSGVSYPANLQNAIAVGAIDAFNKRPPFSNAGENLDIMAPGENISTTDREGSYGYNTASGTAGNYCENFIGTSAACPYVAGIAALMLSANYSLTVQQIRDILENTARKVGGYSYQTKSGRPNGTWHEEVGYGLVDAHKAVVYAFMYGTSMGILGETNINTCNLYSYTCNIYRSDLFTYEWSVTPNLAVTNSVSDVAWVTPIGLGQGTITVKVYAQGRLIYTLTKNVNVNGQDLSSLVSIATTPLFITPTTPNPIWQNHDHLLSVLVTIKSGATLTVSGTVYCSPSAKFIVNMGGKLVINGGTLTNACDDEMWGGIEVQGNTFVSQTDANQGVVELNNATIENAKIGINVSTLYSGRFVWGSGIVRASNSHFINNEQAVYFAPYVDYISGTAINNVSYFKGCHFTVDKPFNKAQVELQGVRGVKFENCNFSSGTQSEGRFDGIYANRSSIRMGNIPLISNGKGCNFSGFKSAIYLKNSGTYQSSIYSSNFDKNIIGICAEGANDLKVGNCQFNLVTVATTISPNYFAIYNPTGIYLKNASLYEIENNNFIGHWEPNQVLGYMGIVSENSGEGNHFIKNNSFRGLCPGVLAVGTNSNKQNSNLSQGLVYQCNSFEGNGNDISVAANSNIKYHQTGLYVTTATGNTFFNSKYYNISNNGNSDIKYQFRLPTTSNHYPSNVHDNPLGGIWLKPENSDWCIGYGYMGRGYYTIAIAELPNLESDYAGKEAMFGLLSENNGENPINWNDPVVKDIVNQLEGTISPAGEFTITINGNPPSTPLEQQIVLFYELTHLKQQMDNICYAALEILGSDSVGLDITEYRKWIGRFNTIESDYLLADSYLELKEFTEAEAILDSMPIKFSNFNAAAHQNYRDYFAVLQEYLTLPAGEEMPAHLVSELVRLSNNNDFVAIKAYSFGEMLVADWRELYPREFEMHSACVCNSGGGVIDPPNINKGGGKGKGKKSLEDNNNLEENINNEIQIFPNPTTGELTINSKQLTIKNVEIYDVVGKLQKFEIKKLDNTIIINISRLANGMYFLKIDRKTFKVVKN